MTQSNPIACEKKATSTGGAKGGNLISNQKPDHKKGGDRSGCRNLLIQGFKQHKGFLSVLHTCCFIQFGFIITDWLPFKTSEEHGLDMYGFIFIA